MPIKDAFSWNTVLSMYAKHRMIRMANNMFDKMPQKDSVSWTTMIVGLNLMGQFERAVCMFSDMIRIRAPPSRFILTNVLSSCAALEALDFGYNQNNLNKEALELFSRMLNDQSAVPDNFTLTSALAACAYLGKLELGKQIHSHILRTAVPCHGQVRNALISMYSKSSGVEMARRVFKQTMVSDLNVIAFTSLLEGYVKLGDLQPAREIFDSMKYHDVIAWTAMIVGYVQNGLNSEAMELFSNSLITMYARSGSIAGAKRVFNQICQSKETFLWTSMIIALAQHGLGEEAIGLFEKMINIGVRPDDITYVGVISACTHAGLVAKGKHYFRQMQTKHMIQPTQSHHTCMIDMLARAGLLQEAQEFINMMPMEADAIAWGSLLSACKVHKDANMAKIAAEKLLAIDPDNSGAYSVLASVYSACGRWDDAAKIWKLMKDKGVDLISGGIINNSIRPKIPTWCDPEWKSLMESCWSSGPALRPSFSEISQKLRKMAAAINLK
ncbi:unnamed protein product [Musa banksii]